MFQVARSIWQGGFASRRLLDRLQEAGIAYVLNVSEAPSELCVDDGPFESVVHLPIVDLATVPVDQAIESLETLHRFVASGNVYVHCMAGWNRSAVVVWLYLVACGIDRDVAKRQIERASYDAVPTHPQLVSEPLIDAVREYGAFRFLPHPRPESLKAVEE